MFKKMTLLVIYGLVLFSAGLYTAYVAFPHSAADRALTESREAGTHKFINPLLECDTNAVSNDTNLEILRNQLNDFINRQVTAGNLNSASVYYRDMNNGPWFGIKEKDLFSPASLIKIPMMIAYYKLSESDPSILTEVYDNDQEYDFSNQDILPSMTLVPKQKYTVEELINRMIIYSDNSAYNILMAHLDNKKLVQVYNDLGIDISKGFTDPNGDILSVKAYSSFFRILYNASYLSHDNSEKALELLSRVQYKNGLVAGLPDAITVSHKFGERYFVETGVKQLHDCGVVYAPGKPYLICIMTRGTDFSKLESTIKNLSAQIYNYIK